MRALIQRVSEADVMVEGRITGKIGCGVLVLLGIGRNDTESEARQLAQKVANLRIFPDAEGKMNRSLAEIEGEMLIVSQFTLYGDSRKGNRPSYSEAARPEVAEPLYEYFIKACQEVGIRVAKGVFQAHMKVRLVNDGPVTVMCYAGQ